LISTSFLAQDLKESFTYGPGNFSHVNRIMLVDAHGNVRGCFDDLNQTTATAAIAEINRLREGL
jgi:hypothetical protein